MASKKKIDETPRPTSLAEAVERVADPKAALLAIVDRAVRDSRDNGWCDAFEKIMDRVVPEMAVATAYDRRVGGPGSTFVDSDGIGCDGYDRDGYHGVTGLHWETGRDRDGFNRYGYNEAGLNREGLNQYGEDPTRPETVYRFIMTNERYRYLVDWDGFSPEGTIGYTQQGDYVTRNVLANLRAQGPEAFVYDRNGNRNPDAVAASE